MAGAENPLTVERERERDEINLIHNKVSCLAQQQNTNNGGVVLATFRCLNFGVRNQFRLPLEFI